MRRQGRQTGFDGQAGDGPREHLGVDWLPVGPREYQPGGELSWPAGAHEQPVLRLLALACAEHLDSYWMQTDRRLRPWSLGRPQRHRLRFAVADELSRDRHRARLEVDGLHT